MAEWLPWRLWPMKLRELFWGKDPEPLEGLSVFVKLTFGGWLIGPGINAFRDNGGELPVISRWASEPVWGTVLILLGVLQGLAIIRGSISVRRWIAMVNAAVWMFVAAMFVSVDPRISAVPFAIVLGLGQAWVHLVLGVRGRTSGG